VRGPGGGYKLARHPSEISVANIITAIDEFKPKRPEEQASSAQEDKYVTKILWDKLSDKIYQFLNSITLEEFSKKPGLDISVQKALEDEEEHSETLFSSRSAA
jgi:Rrf2 family iron-sulfur cluster assembly transcriptional regulator